MLTNDMKESLIDGICDIFKNNIECIILYGSVARQEETEESDIDVAIILHDSMDADTREIFLNWAAEMDLKYNRVFSIIDIDSSSIRKWGDVVPFYKNLQSEGIILWKAA